jgi:hypothetical protein
MAKLPEARDSKPVLLIVNRVDLLGRLSVLLSFYTVGIISVVLLVIGKQVSIVLGVMFLWAFITLDLIIVYHLLARLPRIATLEQFQIFLNGGKPLNTKSM